MKRTDAAIGGCRLVTARKCPGFRGICRRTKALYGSDMRRYITIIMGLLACIGIVDSIYLTLVHYQLLGRGPQVLACSLGSGGCRTVLESPNATLFGVPNSELGILYFAVVLGAVIIRIFTGRWVKPWLFLGLLTVGLAYSLFLLHNMLFVLGVPCPYCIMAHTANALTFVLYTLTNPFEISHGMRVSSVS